MSAPDSGKPAGSSTAQKKISAGAIRLVVLLLALGLAVAALAYDWKVARPQNQAAYEQIMAMSKQRNSQVGFELTTNKHVQELLGKMPVKTEVLNGKTVEHYRWWSGFPGRSYKVYVEYDKGVDGRLLLSAAYLNELPPPPDPTPSMEQVAGTDEQLSADFGGGAPGGGDEGGSGRGEGGDRSSRPEGRPDDAGDDAAADTAAEAPAAEATNSDAADEKPADAAEPKEADQPAANDENAAENSPAETGAADSENQ